MFKPTLSSTPVPGTRFVPFHIDESVFFKACPVQENQAGVLIWSLVGR